MCNSTYLFTKISILLKDIVLCSAKVEPGPDFKSALVSQLPQWNHTVEMNADAVFSHARLFSLRMGPNTLPTKLT